MNCIVCDKPVPNAASNICSTKCMMRARAGGVKATRKAPRKTKGKGSVLNSENVMKMLMSPTPVVREAPMLLVKHRWMKNRNVLSGSLVITFNDQGVAKVPDVGNNRDHVDRFVRNSKGLVSWVEERKPEVVEPPKAKVEPKAKVVEAKVEEKIEKVEEKVEEKKSLFDTSDEKEPLKRKISKRSVKRTPKKKSR